MYHIEAAKQLQFSVKYNVDIAPNINEDGIPFKFRLVDSDKNVYEDYFLSKSVNSIITTSEYALMGLSL